MGCLCSCYLIAVFGLCPMTASVVSCLVITRVGFERWGIHRRDIHYWWRTVFLVVVNFHLGNAMLCALPAALTVYGVEDTQSAGS